MATTEQYGTATGRTNFCPECGTEAGDANFCPGCGHNMHVTAGPPPPTQPAPAQTGHSPRARVALLAACGALGIVVVVVAVVVLTNSGSSTHSRPPASSTVASATYQQQLTTALAPLLTADRTLSAALGTVDGSRPSINAAKSDVSQAQTALSTAQGAVGVLNAPSSQHTLSSQVQQALTAENGYLQAVSSTLGDPAGTGAGQLQTLATGLQSALVPVNAVAPGGSASINGTSNLVSWAQGAAGAAQAAHDAQANNAAAKAAANAVAGSGGGSGVGSGGASSTGAVVCGGGLFAGPHTSCPFAINVQQAWENASSATTLVTAYSPVTNQSYTESCAPDASGGIMCVGVGADNSVWW